MLFVEEIWKTLELWIRKLVKPFTWGLVGPPGRSMVGIGAEGDVGCESSAQEVSVKNISKWPGNRACDILVRNETALYMWEECDLLFYFYFTEVHG